MIQYPSHSTVYSKQIGLGLYLEELAKISDTDFLPR